MANIKMSAFPASNPAVAVVGVGLQSAINVKYNAAQLDGPNTFSAQTVFNGKVSVATADAGDILAVKGSTNAVRVGTDTAAGYVEGVNSAGNVYKPLHVGGEYLQFYTGLSAANTERMRIDASGNVGIGETAPGGVLDVRRNQNSATALNFVNTDLGANSRLQFLLQNSTTRAGFYLFSNAKSPVGVDLPNSLELTNESGSLVASTGNASPIIFGIANTERARITADGFFKASNTGTYVYTTISSHYFETDVSDVAPLTVVSKATSPNGLYVAFTTSPNNTANKFIRYVDSVGDKLNVYANGGIANYSANNVNLSDATLKEDINPYSQQELDSLEQSFKAVQWCRYKYKDQTHSDWNHGYLAQDVATAFANVAPELVDEIDIGAEGKDKSLKRGVYSADLTHIAMALLARALKRIEALEKARK